MKKWLRNTVVILFVAVPGLVIWKATGPVEPAYEGKLLSDWLEGHVRGSAANPPFNSPGWQKADEALRQIGTNAIPTLLRMMRAVDSPAKLKVVRLAEKQRLFRMRYRYAISRNQEAEYAFQVLGSNAVNAVPELIEIYEASLSESSHRCAVIALIDIGRAANAAIPALLKNFTHTNSDVRFHAVTAVAYIGGEPDEVLPALRSVLKDPNKRVCWNAIMGLRKHGTRARPAVPDLLEVLKDETVGVSPEQPVLAEWREQVEFALWSIAPETIARVLVVENSTPMVVNGVTTEALIRRDGDRISTVIPSGSTVPSAAYSSWEGEVDSRLQIVLDLYRGTNQATGMNYDLGQFEVLGIPPPPARVRVQVAYVVVNQQILLCAYDEKRKVFLEMRRVDTSATK
jgi:hypothetical protein